MTGENPAAQAAIRSVMPLQQKKKETERGRDRESEREILIQELVRRSETMRSLGPTLTPGSPAGPLGSVFVHV